MKVLIVLMFFSFSALAKDGRYQLVKHTNSKFDSVLIDTQTGNIWTYRCVTESKEGKCLGWVWDKDDILGVNITEKELVKNYNLK